MPARVLCFGSFVADLMCQTPRLPTPGETVLAGPFRMGPGGKGSNQAIAARRAGAEVAFCTRVGRDAFAELAATTLEQEGISAHLIRDDAHETGAALIMVDKGSGQNMISVSSGACAHFTESEVRDFMTERSGFSVFLTQLETNREAVELAIKLAHEQRLKIIVNPAPVQEIDPCIDGLIDYLTPNEHEAAELTGIPVTDEDGAKRAAKKLMDAGIENVIITLGAKGVFVMNHRGNWHVPAFPVKAIDTTGAGDAFNGGFAAALAEGQPLLEAVRFGAATAALSVTRMGTAPAMPQRDEIDALLKTHA